MTVRSKCLVRAYKAGVMLLDLQDSSVEQTELDLDDFGPDRGKLMGTLDALNTRYGRGSIQQASAGVGGADRPGPCARS